VVNGGQRDVHNRRVEPDDQEAQAADGEDQQAMAGIKLVRTRLVGGASGHG
jgi:hypothetical protein